jgi:NAD(P)-dependent dehydrogenase (short-subunit alcohol dehydrogenase family)
MYRAVPKDGCAWITGASSGIGRALALHLAGQGWRVAVTARRAEALRALAAAHPEQIFAYPGDVTDAARMAEIVADIEREHRLALAVLNAGVYALGEERGPWRAEAAWRSIEINLGGVIRCLDPVLAAMLARRQGQIAIVASLAGYGGIPGSTAYGASKSALITMAEALRLTYQPAGLTIQVVNPGFVATPMTAPNPYPMPFMMEAEDAARVIAKGLARGGFEIAFPRRLVWPMKAAALLPYALWLPLMRYATRRATSKI